MKLIVILLILCILAALGSALFSLISQRGSQDRTVKALALRVALSLLLFCLLIAAYKLGWIQPHGVGR
jgi:hypothetical protein